MSDRRTDPLEHNRPGHEYCWPVPTRTGGRDDKGRGRIRCNICDQPVADHDIGPCPHWDITDGSLTVNAGGPHPRTLERRRQRAKQHARREGHK